MENKLEEGDIVLCTVDRVIGTIVFVNIQGYGEGSIIISEIAPGRIRNLRDYVVPKKRIVCKVLRIKGNKINLSLRRVTQKEKKEVLEKYKQEKSYKSLLKTILKDKAKEIINQIEKKESLYDFFEKAKEDSKELEKIIGKDSKKILEIINFSKKKKAVLKKEIYLTSIKSNGLELIKKILGNLKEGEVRYISAGRYSIKIKGKDLKDADKKLKKILDEIEKQSKKDGLDFKIKEK